MNSSPLKWARSVLPPRLVRILNMTGIFGLFGAVCYAVAGWDLPAAVAGGLLTAFALLAAGEILMYAFWFFVLARRRRENDRNSRFSSRSPQHTPD